MTDADPLEVIELFRAFLSHQPAKRFGQAVCDITAWEDDPRQIPDEILLKVLHRFLKGNFRENAYVTVNSSMSEELVAALREIRQLEPLTPFGQLVSRLAGENGMDLYDIENDELIAAVRNHIAKAREKKIDN